MWTHRPQQHRGRLSTQAGHQDQEACLHLDAPRLGRVAVEIPPAFAPSVNTVASGQILDETPVWARL